MPIHPQLSRADVRAGRGRTVVEDGPAALFLYVAQIVSAARVPANVADHPHLRQTPTPSPVRHRHLPSPVRHRHPLPWVSHPTPRRAHPCITSIVLYIHCGWQRLASTHQLVLRLVVLHFR
eukprot:1529856-Rhodomonas_salina.5